MTKNLYYEFGKWTLFWGMGLDQRKEVQKVMDKYNDEGWHVAQDSPTTIPATPPDTTPIASTNTNTPRKER